MSENLKIPKILEQTLHQFTKLSLSILDLGCGTGENAVALALKGHTVTAIDSGAQAIHDTKLLASIHNASLEILQGDITQLKLDAQFDLVICLGVLHFIQPHKVEAVLRFMKEHTLPSGMNLISAQVHPRPFQKEYAHWVLLHEKTIPSLKPTYEMLAQNPA